MTTIPPLPHLPPFPTPVGGAPLPLTFHPRSLPVLIVGSNRLVATRAFTFLESDADVLVASGLPLASQSDEIQWRVSQGQVRFDNFASTDVASWADYLDAHRIALVCVTDTLIGSTVSDSSRSSSQAQALHSAATRLRIPINVTDQPKLSTYTFPSSYRFPGSDGPSNLQVAVSTNGQGCRLGGRIRREIAAKLSPDVGRAVDNVGRLRTKAKAKASATISEDDDVTPLNKPVTQGAGSGAGHEGVSDSETTEAQLRRMRWVHQMSEYFSYDQLARMTEGEMDAALSSASLDGEVSGLAETAAESQHALTSTRLPHHDDASRRGRILLVGSGPGHPSLLTVAARQAIDTATLILSDKLVPAEVLALVPKTTKLVIARKFPGNAEGAQSELMDLALAGARAGEVVVRLKQGDPFVYGRGGEEVLHFRKHGFEATVVPGVSSALAGPLMLGIPVTQRGVADSLVLCTGVGRAGSAVELPGYVKSRTLAILMGVARIEAVVSVLTGQDGKGRDGAAYPPHLPVAIVERASSPDQRVILSTLENVATAIKSVDQRPPGMILVGWSAMCLEGEGRVDILDGVDESTAVQGWLGGKAWKTREGLAEGWKWFG